MRAKLAFTTTRRVGNQFRRARNLEFLRHHAEGDTLVKIRSTMDQHSSAIDQATPVRFINEGFFLSHIKRMRRPMLKRREFFIKEFNKLLSDRFILEIPEAGLNFLAWLRYEEDFARVARVCADIGVKPSPRSRALRWINLLGDE